MDSQILYRGMDNAERFAIDLRNRFHVDFNDLNEIIRNMGIEGNLEVEFTLCTRCEDYFTISVIDSETRKMKKAYNCAMWLGSMVNPYPGFKVRDEETIKYFSFNEKDHKIELLWEKSIISDEQEEEMDCVNMSDLKEAVTEAKNAFAQNYERERYVFAKKALKRIKSAATQEADSFAYFGSVKALANDIHANEEDTCAALRLLKVAGLKIEFRSLDEFVVFFSELS